MKKLSKILLLFGIFIIAFKTANIVFASHCPPVSEGGADCQLAEIERKIKELTPAHENNKKELSNLNAEILNLKKRLDGISAELDKVSVEISEREEDLEYANKIFEEKTNSHYRFLRVYDPLLPILYSDKASDAFLEINIRQKAVDGDRQTIEQYAKELVDLKNDKETLETNKQSLSAAQASLNGQATFLGAEIEKVENYLNELSAKQEQILAAKAGSFITSVGDAELADDYYASIKGFREAAPAGSYAVFSFGSYTHRKGMSQYGARGRAENGQNYQTILQAYYGKSPVNKDTGGTISVSGYGNLDFENYYLMGIAEMPSSWHLEALKAQAVAARTYAYRYKVQGSSICTTESCQVFSNSKAANPPSAWRQAVEQTRGQVLEDVTTFYSSTAGGYLPSLGWDTTNGSGGSNFIDNAWEAKGGSPWLYKSWYRQGYTASGSTCGRGNPWLSGEELADIVNAALILKNRNDDRITPLLCGGSNPYSIDEMRSAASQYGGVNSVSSVVVHQGNGVTNEVVINGSIHLSGLEFKAGFNLRAPGYLRIPQGLRFGSSSDFAFFNIEKK